MDSSEREEKRKGSGSSTSVVHWSDFQPSSAESTNRLLHFQKNFQSSHKYLKETSDSSYRKCDNRGAFGLRQEHRYNPPPEEHPPPVI